MLANPWRLISTEVKTRLQVEHEIRRALEVRRIRIRFAQLKTNVRLGLYKGCRV